MTIGTTTTPTPQTPPAEVVAVNRSADHSFSKTTEATITLVAGLGVEGDAHFGARVKHRSRVRNDPEKPNLRQVHLIQRELFDEVASGGFAVEPGDMGENITTAGIDLLSLPVGTTLRIGGDALVVLTGLRNPCRQIDSLGPGLMDQVLARDESGTVIRKAGVMGVVVRSGAVSAGDPIEVSFPPAPHRPLEPV